jgi:hypothetical protein
LKSIIQFLLLSGIVVALVVFFVPRHVLTSAKESLLKTVQKATAQGKSKQRKFPYAAERHATESRQPIERALVQFDYTLSRAPRFRLQGRLVSRLPEGHLVVMAHLLQRNKPVAINQTYALFGHPDADKFKETDPIDCFVCTVGPATIDIGRDRPPLVIEELVYMPEDPASKPGGWLYDRDRPGTSLDRPGTSLGGK